MTCLVFCCLKFCHQKESMKHWPLCQQLLHPFRVQLPESPVIPRGGGTLLLVFGEQTDCKMCAYLDFWVAFVVSQFSAIIVSICFLKRGLGEVRPPLSVPACCCPGIWETHWSPHLQLIWLALEWSRSLVLGTAIWASLQVSSDRCRSLQTLNPTFIVCCSAWDT